MSYIALYREWRPTRFKDVVEQEHVVKALRYSVSTGRIAHAYLFCGTRGTGKTTMAHILSRAVNCLDPHDGEPCNQCEICREILSGSSVDVLEIDAASNNSVDNVRSIRDEVIYAPTKAKRKVYIIDEVHMLSTGAFNALLKTLEEPPEHVIFILATTEPHKLPATILSRCQRFDFRRISLDSIVEHISKIAASDGITLGSDAARLIARMADGAMRDAISLLDQCMSLGRKTIEYDDVLSVVGIVNDEFMTGFIADMLDKNVVNLLQNISRLVSDGRDAAHFVSDLVMYFRNLMILKSTGGKCDELIDVPSAVLSIMKKQTSAISLNEIMRYIRELSALENGLKYAVNPRVLLEVTLIKICGSSSDSGAGSIGADLEARLAAIEERLNSGNFPASAQTGGLRPAMTQGIGDTPQPAVSISSETAGLPGSSKLSDQTEQYGVNTGTTPQASDSTADTTGSSSKKDAAVQKASGDDTSIKEAVEYDKWPAVMKHLKSLGKMAIYTILLNIRAVLIDDSTVGLVSPDASIRTMVSKVEHIKMIEEAVQKTTGREMKIRCIDDDVLRKAFSAEAPQESSDMLKRARLIAERAGLPLEIIDE
jgi:DNA polymerase-3 subunit gamma/tau